MRKVATMARTTLAAAVAAALSGVGAPALAADIITFNPYGDGNPLHAIQVDTFDWAPGSALAVGGNNLPLGGTTFAPPAGGGKQFQLLAQSTLGGLQLGGSTYGVDTPLPLPSLFPQLTFVASFPEIGWAPTPGSGQFLLDPTPPSASANYFEVWSNTSGAAFANTLTGSGFNDGTLVFSGVVTVSNGNFSVNQAAAVPLDQAGINNWSAAATGLPAPGQLTVTGTGGSQLEAFITPITVNQNYFPNGLPQVSFSLFDTQTNLPFNKGNNPSTCFVSAAGGTASSSCNATAFIPPGISLDPTATNPLIGQVNGALGPAGGPDVMLMTDGSNSYRTIVPLPAAAWLLGSGLVGFLGLGYRRAQRTT